jgi:CO/xanthine dehydrogenase Mo-binding subunit
MTRQPDSATVDTTVDAPPWRFQRADGPAKVSGSAQYVADLTLPGQLVGAFKYSNVAHARIRSIDTSAARELPGVFAVLTADDVPDVMHGLGVVDQRLFAKDVVRFKGEIVAAVAAIDHATATAAIAAIGIVYDPLPVVNDLAAAIAAGAPLVHTEWEQYEVRHPIAMRPNVASFSSISRGDADDALAVADHVVTSRYRCDPAHAVPIEPRAVLARWEGESVTIWSSTQVPFTARAGVCETLQLPANRVRVIVPHLGGGFGGKCGFHIEAHVAALARKARRPVKVVFTRHEEFTAPDHRRESMTLEITSGVTSDGVIVARRGRILIDNGAYTGDAFFFSQFAAMHLGGPYSIPNVHIEASLVYTNRQPSGSVRAPTAPQTCWAVESHTDEIAELIGIDAIELRRRNLVGDGRPTITGQDVGSVGLRRCLDHVVTASGYGSDLPPGEAIGVGISWWPSNQIASGAYITMHQDGSCQIITGAQECGTGAVMTLRQLAADELGLDPNDFELVYQDTGVGPYDFGSSGSQTLVNNGRAVVEGARDVARQLKDLAADSLEAAAADIVLEAGAAHVAGSPERSITIAELAKIGAGGQLLLGRGSGELQPPPRPSGADCVGDIGLSAWMGPQFACHAIRVRVDRDTGVCRVLEAWTSHDSGTIINPVGARGQVEGGVVMGIGQALSERTVYDENAQQLNTALLEYKLQTAADAPLIHVHFVEDGDPGPGPFGAKGLAEAPNVPTPAAIANAIARVIGRHVDELPMTAERVWSTVEAPAP